MRNLIVITRNLLNRSDTKGLDLVFTPPTAEPGFGPMDTLGRRKVIWTERTRFTFKETEFDNMLMTFFLLLEPYTHISLVNQSSANGVIPCANWISGQTTSIEEVKNFLIRWRDERNYGHMLDEEAFLRTTKRRYWK